MILAARRFIERPSIRFFKSVHARKEMKFADNLIVIKFNYKHRSPDIIWGQLKSSAKAIAKQLSINGFKVIRYTSSTDENGGAVFAFMLESITVPKMIVRQGPKAFERDHTEKFLEKNLKKSKMIWVGDDTRVFALLDSRFDNAVSFLKFLLSKNINASGIAPGLMSDLRKGFQIYSGKRVKSVKDTFVKEAVSELVTTDRFAFG
jgi:tRNA nucleotidyltransferase (CCA-adding enzyme)